MSNHKEAVTGQTAINVLQWVTWADDDYLAARALLLSGLLVQGSAFSNTAIEKYLKGILTTKGLAARRFGHDVVKLYESAKNTDGKPLLNPGYLRTLLKAYCLRYPDDLKKGFNIRLAQAQMLAELDSSVQMIRKGFVFQKNNSSIQTKFDSLLKSNDPRLTERNAAFTRFNRADVFANPSECYELRVMANGEIFEANYRADVKDTGEFESEALTPGPGGQVTLTLCHEPH